MTPSVGLIPSLQIGFSGHRNLTDEQGARSALFEVLKLHQSRSPEGVCGLSSLAAGGDLVFAEVCLELQIPLRVLLPLPVDQFRADFDADVWRRVETALQAAASLEVYNKGSSRPDCYHECGLQSIYQSSLVIVLWNGLPAQGLGGTGELVQSAKRLQIPVIWIHSESFKLTKWNFNSAEGARSELQFLNSLPDYSVQSTSTPQEQVYAWFRKLDLNADAIAPQFRKIVAIPIICAGSCTLFTMAGSVFREQAKEFLIISAVLGLFAILARTALGTKATQRKWARIRTAAEISRSFLAVWQAPCRYNVIDEGEVPELVGMTDALNLVKLRAGCVCSKTDLADFKANYQTGRIDDQSSYFARNAAKANKTKTRASILKRVALAFAISGNIFIVGWKFRHFTDDTQWMALSIVLAFQVAGASTALIIVNDYARRQWRYVEMQRVLKTYRNQLDEAQTWGSVLELVKKVERVLLAEVLEWRGLFVNQRIGK